MDKDLVYYRLRSAQERAAAFSSTSVPARAAHQEMARLYDERLAALEALRRRAEMHVVAAA